MENSDRSSAAEFVDDRLIKRLRIYLIIMVIMLIVVFFEVAMGIFSISWALGSILIGFGVGVLISRIYHLSWDDETSHVIGQMDKIGAVILLFYLVFIFTRTYYLGHWVQGAPLLALIFSITAGTMLGRVMSTERGIKKIIKAANILDI